jgi:IS1 family transposase
MTMLSREPRQIVAYAVDNSVKAALIQEMADNTVQAGKYYTDGGNSYLGVDFTGRHIRNLHDKSDTHNIEGSNADLRHYIAGLRRKSRCFFRSVDTLQAVLYVFVHAYNRFGDAKMRYMQNHPNCKRVYHLDHIRYV